MSWVDQWADDQDKKTKIERLERVLEAAKALDLYMMQGHSMYHGHPLHMKLREEITKAQGEVRRC